MLYQILKKKTNGHNVTILYSPELAQGNYNICCYAVIDENLMVEAEFIPSSYQSCGDDFDEVNEYTGFRFKYKDEDVILTIDEIQEKNFLRDRELYYWIVKMIRIHFIFIHYMIYMMYVFLVKNIRKI